MHNVKAAAAPGATRLTSTSKRLRCKPAGSATKASDQVIQLKSRTAPCAPFPGHTIAAALLVPPCRVKGSQLNNLAATCRYTSTAPGRLCHSLLTRHNTYTPETKQTTRHHRTGDCCKKHTTWEVQTMHQYNNRRCIHHMMDAAAHLDCTTELHKHSSQQDLITPKA